MKTLSIIACLILAPGAAFAMNNSNACDFECLMQSSDLLGGTGGGGTSYGSAGHSGAGDGNSGCCSEGGASSTSTGTAGGTGG